MYPFHVHWVLRAVCDIDPDLRLLSGVFVCPDRLSEMRMEANRKLRKPPGLQDCGTQVLGCTAYHTKLLGIFAILHMNLFPLLLPLLQAVPNLVHGALLRKP